MNTNTQNAPKEVLDEVLKEYETTLIISKNKQTPQWMLMPVGLIGSGKSTVTKPLADHFGLIRISTDEIRQVLKQKGFSYEGARDIAHNLQIKYLNQGYSIAVDANTGSATGIEFNKKTEKDFPHVRQIFIHINPPEEFIVNKLKNYKHTWLFNDGEEAVCNFKENLKKFSLPNLPFIYEFDTSRENLDQQIGEAIDLINKSLGR